ncbi:MAG: hypothetical protein E6H52_06240 [Betaproteobacteria bacterium]|nr:MAG: hypothetical protein E6H52_06240 [Betaproteobacteria bacterium]
MRSRSYAFRAALLGSALVAPTLLWAAPSNESETDGPTLLQKLPEPSPEQYAPMTGDSESAHKMPGHGQMHINGGEVKHDESQPHEHGKAAHEQPR